MHTQIREDDPIGHLTSPIVTGGAVIAVKCREGVLIATDTLLSYGGLLSIPKIIQSTMASIDTNKYQVTWW
jgi:20S proteasome alpha/beta subunit